MKATLVIPAAGRGERFGSELPKQFLPLAGMSVLARSLAAFAGLVEEAVIAAGDSQEMRARVDEAIAQARAPFPVRVVAGGATRMRSVAAALAAATGEIVLIHDAVRPLVPRACIEACLHALADAPAAVVAIPCAHTVKRARDGAVTETVPREELWLAQTPQGFRRDLGADAFARAIAEDWSCSDDAQVLERAGHRVAIVMGDARNLKITTRDDFALAEAILALGSDGRGATARRRDW